MFRYLCYVAAWWSLLQSSQGDRISLRLMEDRLWLNSDKAPIQDLMEEFSQLGVDVRLDPSIRATIHGTLENVDIEKALQEILSPFSYVLQWRQIAGPSGPLILLDQMDVFQTGKRDQVQPIQKRSLEIVQPPDGAAYIKEELLLALNTRISPEKFRLLLDRVGGTLIDSLHPPGIYRVRLGMNADVFSLVALLRAEEGVYHAEPNYAYVPIWTKNLSSGDGVGLPSIPPPAKGQPAVAVLDSGIMSLEKLKSQVVAKLDATQPGAPLRDPSGHGTQMALIASGLVLPTNTEAIEGSVPVVAVKAFDENGRSSSFDLLNGLTFAAEKGAGVVNMSWGSEAESKFLHDLLVRAKARDMLLVAAAGNKPTGRPVYPAAFPEVLSVGALGSDGSRWDQSNYGSFVDLAAPGSARMPVGHNGPPGSYGGTSISSAYTAKMLAAYRTKHPQASSSEITKKLMMSLTDHGPPGRDPFYGNGALDNNAVSRFLR